MKHAYIGIVLASAIFSGSLSAQTTSRGCQISGVLTGGDTSLSTISSTGSIDLPCLVEFRPSMEADGRGRTNYNPYLEDGWKDPPPPPHRLDSSSLGQDLANNGPTLSLGGFLTPTARFPDEHKSSVFAIKLASNQLDRELRVNLLARNNEYRLQAAYVDFGGAQSTSLGEIIIDKSASFGLALSKSGRKGFLNLRLSSGAAVANFEVKGTLFYGQMSGWSYGLLLDDSADNKVPYSLLLAQGARPQISKN